MAISTIKKDAIIEYFGSVVTGSPLTIPLLKGGEYLIIGAGASADVSFMGIVNVASGGSVTYVSILSATSITITTGSASITVTNSTSIGSKVSLVHLLE